MYFNSKVVQSTILAKIINRWFVKDFYKNIKESAKDVVWKLTQDSLLRATLLGQFGNYGQLPSEASFYIHASVVNHYLNGGFYPRGGSTVFAKQIIPTIEKMGGRCLVRNAVSEIIVKRGRACGVLIENGDEIYAANVIAACGVHNTYNRLLSAKYVPNSLIIVS